MEATQSMLQQESKQHGPSKRQPAWDKLEQKRKPPTSPGTTQIAKQKSTKANRTKFFIKRGSKTEEDAETQVTTSTTAPRRYR